MLPEKLSNSGLTNNAIWGFKVAYPYFRLYSKGWLEGSIRQQLTIEERSVFADLLAFANECRERGVIARAPGIPFPRQYLADRFGVPLELLNSTIERCSQDGNDPKRHSKPGHRIEVLPDGTLVITNWAEYQGVKETQLTDTPPPSKSEQALAIAPQKSITSLLEELTEKYSPQERTSRRKKIEEERRNDPNYYKRGKYGHLVKDGLEDGSGGVDEEI